MFECLKTLFEMCLVFFKFAFILCSPILFMILVFFLYYKFIKKMKKEKTQINWNERMNNQQQGILYRLLFLFPKQFVLNFFNKKDAMEEYGIWIIAGSQGARQKSSGLISLPLV